MAARPDCIGVVVSCDVDDVTMTGNDIQQQLLGVIGRFEWNALYYGANATKIEACNADIEKVDYPWDIIVLVSDDMIPDVRGYDEYIRRSMTPDRDCVLWFNDGFQGTRLNTLSIYGRTMYNRFGSVYAPEYKSFYCDTELTDLCKTTLMSKTVYSPLCIIRHRHPGLGYKVAFDSLYVRNHRYLEGDLRTYISRKAYEFDLSILIPTLVERRAKCEQLKTSLRERFARICPGLRLEIAEALDNREMSVGLKRQELIERAKGKYVSFVDDDDLVTDEYFEDAAECIKGKYDMCRLRGTIGIATFTHSLRNNLEGPAAAGYEFLRPPNHLNIMLKDIANLNKFGDLRYGEDMEWMVRLSQGGFLKSEYASGWSRVHYIYNYRAEIKEKDIEDQRKMTCMQLVYVILGKPIVVGKEKKLKFGPKGFVSV